MKFLLISGFFVALMSFQMASTSPRDRWEPKPGHMRGRHHGEPPRAGGGNGARGEAGFNGHAGGNAGGNFGGGGGGGDAEANWQFGAGGRAGAGASGNEMGWNGRK